MLSFDMIAIWMRNALTFWQKNPNIKPSPAVVAFVLELMGLVWLRTVDSLDWSNILIYEKLCERFNITSDDTTLQVKVAYVKMLTSFLEHR